LTNCVKSAILYIEIDVILNNFFDNIFKEKKLETLLEKPIPREKIIKDLSQKLNLKLFIEDPTINKELRIVKFSIENRLQVIGVFNDPIFSTYPDKVTEVLEKLITLIQKKFPTFPKGKLKFEVSGGFAALTCNSESALVSINDSHNAFGTALCFLGGKNAKDYISSLN